MRATVALDDELVGKAQELTGVTERTALLRAALKALVHLEASRRLAAVGGTEPELEEIKRVRADKLGTTKVPKEVRRAEIAAQIIPSGTTPTATQMTELQMAMRKFESEERKKPKRRGRWSVR
jgi:Arc/MetJ family transcription regulator